MKKIFLLLFLVVLVQLPVRPCLNYYYVLDSDGHFHEQTGGFTHFDINFNKEKIVQELHQLEKKLAKEHNYTALSDYAVGLMKLGKTEEARDILAELYRHYPHEYRLATNLGTAYELTGEVDSALVYIRRGLELNPKDHEGSEWIHVKILEAKQKLKKDPAYLRTHTVLDLTEAQEKDLVVRNQVEIQVRERFPFSPGPDPIMASLMENLGDAYAEGYSIEYAKAFYDIAKEYFGNTSERLVQKISKMKSLQQKYAGKKPEPEHVDMEGTHTKLGGVPYKYLLDDNDSQTYQVDWSKTNTDVNALLAYADLTKTIEDIRAEDKNSGDSLHLAANDTQEVADPAKKSGTGPGKKQPFWLYGTLLGIIILAAGYFFTRKKRSS